MTFSYNDFKTQVSSTGLSRQNRFFINIAPPHNGGELRNVHLLCSAINVPGVSLASQPVRYTGEVIEAAYDRTFSAATFTFYVDRDMKVRKFFDDWINIVQNPYTRSVSYREEYESPITSVYVLRMDNQTSYQLDMWECYPKSIGALNLSSDNTNVMTLDVTMDYRKYTTTTFTPGTSTTITNTLLGGKADVISQVTKSGSLSTQFLGGSNPIETVGDLRKRVDGIKEEFNTAIDPYKQAYSGFKNTLDGYYNDISGFQNKIQDSLGILNQYGIRLDSNVAAKVSQTISQASRSSVYSAVQKTFGKNLGVFL